MTPDPPHRSSPGASTASPSAPPPARWPEQQWPAARPHTKALPPQHLQLPSRRVATPHPATVATAEPNALPRTRRRMMKICEVDSARSAVNDDGSTSSGNGGEQITLRDSCIGQEPRSLGGKQRPNLLGASPRQRDARHRRARSCVRPPCRPPAAPPLHGPWLASAGRRSGVPGPGLALRRGSISTHRARMPSATFSSGSRPPSPSMAVPPRTTVSPWG